MKKVTVFVVIALFAVMLTGCGNKYSFDQKELASSIEVKKEVFDKMDVKPDSDGKTGVELMDHAMAMTRADSYTYWFERDGSEDEWDIVNFFFYGGKVSSVTLMTFGEGVSEYSLLGIKAGMSRETAEAAAEARFGGKGEALSDDAPMWGLTDQKVDYITYSNKKENLTVKVDMETGKVISAEYTKV